MVVEFGPDDTRRLIFGYVATGTVLLILVAAGLRASVKLIRGRPLMQPGKQGQRYATVSALVILVSLFALSVGLGGMTLAIRQFLLAAIAVLAVAVLRDRRSP